MSKDLRDLLASIFGYNLAVAGVIYLSMAFFVRWLKYD